eukprot:Pgem_evm1s9077
MKNHIFTKNDPLMIIFTINTYINNLKPGEKMSIKIKQLDIDLIQNLPRSLKLESKNWAINNDGTHTLKTDWSQPISMTYN